MYLSLSSLGRQLRFLPQWHFIVLTGEVDPDRRSFVSYRDAYCNGYQQAYYRETENIETANITGANEPE